MDDRTHHSPSWHRVAHATPRLRPDARFTRQTFRGETWHIIEEPMSGQFARLDTGAYTLVQQLNGSRTVDNALARVEARLRDDAPTRHEAVTLLARLASLGLLLTPTRTDAPALVRAARRQRVRETRGYLSSLLFARIPLVNPMPLVEPLSRTVGWLVSPIGAALWIVLIAFGIAAVLSDPERLARGLGDALLVEHPLVLALVFVVLKLIHELAHAVACRTLGKRSDPSGDAGVVRTLGVMLLVLVPVPYVDATSAWSLPDKWKRALVSAAGMIVELAIAAIAAVVWATAGEGTLAERLALATMLLASVATLLFNANPLLRFDAYYILTDLIESPNLAQRSRDAVRTLWTRAILNITDDRPPTTHAGERLTLILYGLASWAYRVLLALVIILSIIEQRLLIGSVLIVAALVQFVVIPLFKSARFLATDPRIETRRLRAAGATVGALLVLLALLTLIPLPRHTTLAGVATPVDSRTITVPDAGRLAWLAAEGSLVQEGDALVRIESAGLGSQLAQLRAETDRLDARRRAASAAQQPAEAKRLADRIASLRERQADLRSRIDALTITAPFAGSWSTQQAHRLLGQHVPFGREIGVLHAESSRVVAPVPQGMVTALEREGRRPTLRLHHSPARTLDAHDLRIIRVDEPGERPRPTFRARASTDWGGNVPRPGASLSLRVRLDDRTLAERLVAVLRRALRERQHVGPGTTAR